MTAENYSCLELVQRLIRVRSLPGAEGDLAALVSDEMRRLGYDAVRIDEVGNVIGRIRGSGEEPPVMFNTHLDHVDVGDEAAWPHPPYGGEIHQGSIWGRGAVDIKGPMAAQIVAASQLLDSRPPGDVVVSCVVQEEIGGVGARHLVGENDASVVVVGEPSSNQIRRGHRGRTELELRVRGRSVHASAPERGVNPLLALGHFLTRLDEVEHQRHPELGCSTVAPTLITSDQTSANVIPAEVTQICDWRNVPGETAEDAQAALAEVAASCSRGGAELVVSVPSYSRLTYTGVEVSIPGDNPAYVLAEDHPVVVAAAEIASRVLGRPVPVGLWKFATDGGHFAAAGVVPVGFGPGDESLAHTIDEHLVIEELEEAVRVNRQLALELPRRGPWPT